VIVGVQRNHYRFIFKLYSGRGRIAGVSHLGRRYISAAFISQVRIIGISARSVCWVVVRGSIVPASV